MDNVASKIEKIDFLAIEQKWQKEWDKVNAFEVKDDSKKPKSYVLEMFPYPSGAGLHMGHALNYTIGDIYSRFKRMSGFNVLYPMGYDAFGLPAENAAIKAGEHPKSYTSKSMKNFVAQQRALGLSYDWSRLLITCVPEYYKWNQFFFLKFLENGLVYRKKAAVNWCPKCNTVLANEQVHSGKCWRHEDTDVELKQLAQWFIKTTKYSEELLTHLPNLQWPDRIKLMQENWIGKSFGSEVIFEINNKPWPIFTTRVDTIFGVTFMVVSAQHSRLDELVTNEQKPAVDAFLKKLKSVSEKELELMDKEGAFTGSYAINPANKEKVPVWVGNFVVADYGSGMVMAVPAHDERDYQFALKYGIPMKQVIAPTFVTSKGIDAVRVDKKFVEREAVFGIVKHWKEDKYFLLDWKEFGWKTFVIGGIEGKETSDEALRREILEETGYQDIKSIKEVAFETYASFFARHKDVNRKGHFRAFLVELGSDSYVGPTEEGQQFHKGSWVSKKEFGASLNLENQIFVWKSFVKGIEAFCENGTLVNSGKFSGTESNIAIEAIVKELESKKLGKKTVNYKFRDWLISRQRYWGAPIPIIYCDKCGAVPVEEKDLPIVLPEKVVFGEGNPLLTNSDFVNTTCPKCNGLAKRETDTMDTFFDSSWYFLRFCDNKNSVEPFDKKKVSYFMPVDQYIGGAEHACMHLIYARFFTKALRDMGLLDFDEPFIKLFNQGMLHGADGNKMSKSLGNVVNPIDIIQNFSADSLRFNLMSLSAPNSDSVWSDSGMESAHKFLSRVFDVLLQIKIGKSKKLLESKLHRTVKEVSNDIENFKYNLAIIKLRALFDSIAQSEEVSKETIEFFIKILHPICPHLTEELWNKLGNESLLSLASWPKTDESKIDLKLEKTEEIISTLRVDILRIKELAKLSKVSKVRLFVSPAWKWTALKIVQDATNGKPDFGVAMKAVMSNNEMKKYGGEMQAFLKTTMNRLGELMSLEKFDEVAVLNEAKPMLEKEFGLIEIVLADDSKEPKAKIAFPGKPALLIE
ncbi:MAG: class I tRNA ligase family protein [archaeon]